MGFKYPYGVYFVVGLVLAISGFMTMLGWLPFHPDDDPVMSGFLAGCAGLIIVVFGVYSVVVLPLYILFAISFYKRYMEKQRLLREDKEKNIE